MELEENEKKLRKVMSYITSFLYFISSGMLIHFVVTDIRYFDIKGLMVIGLFLSISLWVVISDIIENILQH